ncbi:unnamed protein product [Diamesa serratosioi]
MDYHSEVSLFPPTPPPMPNSQLELLVVEPLQEDLTEVVVVNDPVEVIKLVSSDSILDNTVDDSVLLSSVSVETIIEIEPEVTVIMPSVPTISIIEPEPEILVLLPEPIVEKEPVCEPEPEIREINFDCMPMEVQD